MIYACSIQDALEYIKASIIEAKKKKVKLRESKINGKLVKMSSKEGNAETERRPSRKFSTA